VELARERGIKAALLRPITLWPFPEVIVRELAGRVRGMLVAEMNAGQMVEDVRLAVEGRVPVQFHGRMGGIIPSPDEVVAALERLTKRDVAQHAEAY
jgi:2-oxoglutarate/2-oxoacid ferredoxin oxidoreductase subunit alpha